MTRTMTPRERIAKARINLLTDYPFFGSIAMHLYPRELSKEEVKKGICPTMGIDIYGNLLYNPEFVKSMSDKDLKFVIAHEVMHVALKHLYRLGTRDHEYWNYATDATVNDSLGHSFQVPPQCIRIPKMSGKSSEEVYDWLLRNAKLVKVPKGYFFDTHIYSPKKKKGGGGSGKPKQGSGSPFKQKGQQPLDVPRMVKEAWNFARQQGKLPGGMERLFGDILDPVMNWKDIMRKFLISILPHDWTYTRPSKKSVSTGFYMPRVLRENIELVIGVDSSGSIRDTEYVEFLSEIYSMCKQFENLHATVLVCDAAIQDVVEINNAFDPHCVKGRGYGGTSSLPVYRWIADNKQNHIKLLVYFTDGWIDIPREDLPFHTLWIVTAQGDTKTVKQMDNATTIKIPRRNSTGGSEEDDY